MDSPRASSGKNAAAMFSPVPKKTFDSTINANASATSPGPTNDSSAVPITQPTVVSRYFDDKYTLEDIQRQRRDLEQIVARARSGGLGRRGRGPG